MDLLASESPTSRILCDSSNDEVAGRQEQVTHFTLWWINTKDSDICETVCVCVCVCVYIICMTVQGL